MPTGTETGLSALTPYGGGMLVASDDTSGNTIVEYAKAGSNLNKSSSYKRVADVHGEDLTGISGNALMTDPGGSLTGGERIRFFNGSSFGTWHKVPEPSGGDDAGFALQKVESYVHVSLKPTARRRPVLGVHDQRIKLVGRLYLQLGYQSFRNFPVLTPIGSGICYETDGGPVRAQPLMNPQSVKIHLQSSTVKTGNPTQLVGSSSVHLNHDHVTIQQLNGKSWKKFGMTTESAGGSFSFKIPGYSHEYRAVTNDDPGYFQFGYSNTVTLTAKK